MLLNRFHYKSPDNKFVYFGRMVQSHSNIGVPPVKFIEDSGPQQHGVNVRDWRINPRTITLELFAEGETCCDTRGEIMAKLIDTIRPNRGITMDSPGWLRFVNDNWQMVEIPVFVLQGPTGDFNYGGSVGRRQVQDAIQFYAFDPVWREVEKKTILVTGDNWGYTCLRTSASWRLDQGFSLDDGLTLDTSIGEIESCLFSCHTPEGNSTGICLVPYTYIMQTFNIVYTGTWVGDQIDIRLTGPMTQATITNHTTNKQIQLNYNIAPGNYVVITIRPEYATVVDQDGQNLIGSITSISDLVDFELATSGAITPSGLNRLSVAALDSDLDTTQIQIEYYVRHISAYGNPACVAREEETSTTEVC